MLSTLLETPLYTTNYGSAYVGDALELLDNVESASIDLVMTSPPFALQREKDYGNVEQKDYVDWLFGFCKNVYRVLKPEGSFVIDLGGAYKSKRPVRSLHNYRILILDIFAGSNTTGAAAEAVERNWLAFEQNPSYLAASAFRFMDVNQGVEEAAKIFQKLLLMPENEHIAGVRSQESGVKPSCSESFIIN